jgi:alkanesulfonate monooxygenase SsuD/methylene tetrahydromethanopterin reductase-like flavin-dependent oxidoreductase (luciferase family)
MRHAFEAGAQAAGKDPQTMPILAEHFVVVGGEQEARESAEQWRFIPKAWSQFVNNPDPRAIQQQAEAEISDEQVIKQWLVSADPEEHVHSIRQLFDAGITEVYIHSGQADQMRVVNFYGQEVLPRLRR